jgi:hypothetical protein
MGTYSAALRAFDRRNVLKNPLRLTPTPDGGLKPPPGREVYTLLKNQIWRGGR